MTLRDQLTRKKKAVVGAWLEVALNDYPAESVRFLKSKKDQFHNPIGHALSEEMGALFDAVLAGDFGEATVGSLDRILRQRAVQDFSASRAVAFTFALKSIVRREVAGERTAGKGKGLPHPPLHPPENPGA